MSGLMHQTASHPTILEELVNNLEYRPGWQFSLEDVERDQDDYSEGLTLKILTQGYDTYHPDRGDTYRVYHYFIVPAATYNEQSWRRWLLDQILKVEIHEACEFFVIDDDRPYAPHHGPGNDPYIIFDHGSDVDRRTSFRGDVKSMDAPQDPLSGGPDLG